MKHITFKASVTVFVIILVGLSIGLYLMGYQSPAMNYFNQVISDDEQLDESFSVESFLTDMKDAILSPFGLGTIGVIAIFSLVSLAGVGHASQSILLYVIPILILFGLSNVLFFPFMSYAQAEGLPDPMGLLLQVVLNIILLLAILSFVSGRE